MRKCCFFLLSFCLCFSMIGSLSAKASSSEDLHDLEVISFSTETVHKNDVEVSITSTELAGSEYDLQNMLNKLNEKEGLLISDSAQYSGLAVPNSITIGNSTSFTGNNCTTNSYVMACSYANGSLSLNAFGFTGFTTNGTAVSQITRQNTQIVSEQLSRPRIKITAYGLVGGSSIVVNTYEYRAPSWASLVSHNWDETEGGIIAYVFVQVGADFTYKVNGTPNSLTVWAELE